MRVSNFLSKLLKLSKSSRAIFASVFVTALLCHVEVIKSEERSDVLVAADARQIVTPIVARMQKHYQSPNLQTVSEENAFAHAIKATLIGWKKFSDGWYREYEGPDGGKWYEGPPLDKPC